MHLYVLCYFKLFNVLCVLYYNLAWLKLCDETSDYEKKSGLSFVFFYFLLFIIFYYNYLNHALPFGKIKQKKNTIYY
jgi:hypothetical protein